MANATSGRSIFGWYYGWNIVAVCSLVGAACTLLTVSGFSLFLPDWSADLHVPISTLMLGMTVYSLGYAIVSPIVGMVADRFPIRFIMAFGVAGMALLCIGMSYATHIWQYLLIYGVAVPVSAASATTIPANAVVMRWFVRRLGLALALTSVSLSLAAVILAPVLAHWLPVIGWRTIWRVGGIAIGVVALPLVLLMIRERPAAGDSAHYLSLDGAVAQQGHAAPVAAAALRWRDILARRNFWLLAVAYLTLQSLNGGVGYNLVPIAANFGLSEQAAGFLISAWSFAMMGGMFGSGVASDKFGNRLPLAVMCLLSAVGGICVIFGHAYVLLLAGALLTGLGGGYWPVVASTLAAEYGSAGFGRAFGALMVLIPIGAAPAFGLAKAREMSGSYVPALLVLTALCVVGAIASMLMRQGRGGDETPQKEIAIGEAVIL